MLASAILGLGFVLSTGPLRAQSSTDPVEPGMSIAIWKTIALGTHRNVDALRGALRRANCRIGDVADEILDQPAFMTSPTKSDVDLVMLSVAEMGFAANGASLAQIYGRAMLLGLELSPAEVAPQLRLQYLRQPRGEFLRIAMEPVTTARGGVVAFIVGNGGTRLLLIGGDARPDLIVPATVRFVFLRPRQISMDEVPTVRQDDVASGIGAR
jgi:hypothetical protein